MKARGIALALIVAGCSVVNDPGRHHGASDAGGAMDAAARDAAPGVDAPSATDAGPAPIEPLDFCGRLIDAYCRARIQCCTAAASEPMATCVTNNRPECDDLLTAYLVHPRNQYSPERAGTELAEFEAYFAGDACDPDVLDWLTQAEGILSIMRGTLTDGDQCLDADFEEVFACQRPRVCTRVGPLSWQCQPRVARDGACRDNAICPETDYCEGDLDNGTVDGACVPKLANGTLCLAAAECESHICAGEPPRCQPRTADVYCTDPFAGVRQE